MPDSRPDSRLLLQKLAGIALMSIAGLLWAFFFYGITSGGLGGIGGAVIGGIGALAAHKGVRLFNRARQIESATTDNKGEANDNRPPVIYLRSFMDDTITAATVSELKGTPVQLCIFFGS